MFHKKFFIAAGAVILAGSIITSLILYKNKSTGVYRKDIFVMDTYCDIKLDCEETDETANILYELENQFDCHNESSDISQLNSGLSIDKNTETGEIISKSLELQTEYQGGVDITAGSLTALWDITGDNPHVPEKQELENVLPSIGAEHIHIYNNSISLDNGTAIDLGAVAKGYALDKIKEYLDSTDTSYGTVSMTSSMLLYGEKPDGKPFRVAVSGAEDNEIIGYIETQGGFFISSSGAYERYFTDEYGNTYSHILDPETGYPVETDLEAVTVICKSGIESDYLSTLIFMSGTDNIDKYLHSDEYKIAAADSDGNLYVSDGLNFTEKEN